MESLKIAIQAKGRLNEQSISLLEKAGITVNDSKRRLLSHAEGFPLDVLYLRDDDIPQAVSMGVADLGIVGENEIQEKGFNVEHTLALGFGKCRLSLAVPDKINYTGISFFNGKRVATSYPNILRRYFDHMGITADVHCIEGSVEIAPAIGMADAIFDIVSSGATLVSNGLEEVERVCYSQALLISNRCLNKEKQKLKEHLVFRFNSIIESRGLKYVLMNIPKAKIDEAVSIIPGMRSPTILPLAQTDWCSIHAVIAESCLWDSVERLKEIGAEGILVLTMENMIR